MKPRSLLAAHLATAAVSNVTPPKADEELGRYPVLDAIAKGGNVRIQRGYDVGPYDGVQVGITTDPVTGQAEVRVMDRPGGSAEIFIVDPGDGMAQDLIDQLNGSEMIKNAGITVGTIAHVGDGAGLTGAIMGLGGKAVSQALSDSIRRLDIQAYGEDHYAPPHFASVDGRRDRKRGSAPSPAERLLLKQQQKRKKNK